jgi:hypothetical protein
MSSPSPANVPSTSIVRARPSAPVIVAARIAIDSHDSRVLSASGRVVRLARRVDRARRRRLALARRLARARSSRRSRRASRSDAAVPSRLDRPAGSRASRRSSRRGSIAIVDRRAVDGLKT